MSGFAILLGLAVLTGAAAILAVVVAMRIDRADLERIRREVNDDFDARGYPLLFTDDEADRERRARRAGL